MMFATELERNRTTAVRDEANLINTLFMQYEDCLVACRHSLSQFDS